MLAHIRDLRIGDYYFERCGCVYQIMELDVCFGDEPSGSGSFLVEIRIPCGAGSDCFRPLVTAKAPNQQTYWTISWSAQVDVDALRLEFALQDLRAG